MRKMKFWYLAGIYITVLVSCSPTFQSLEEKAANLSSKMNANFIDLRESVHTIVQKTESAFKGNQMVPDDLPTLVKKGELGLFKTPEGSILYGTDKTLASFYFSPGEGYSPNMERASRIFLTLAETLNTVYVERKNYLSFIFIGLHGSESVALFQPRVNTSTLYPPNLDLAQFEWFNRGQKSQGSGIWSTEPFTDLSTGWVEDIAESFNSGSAEKGVVIASVNIRLLAAQLQKLDPSGKYLLLSPNHTVIIKGTALKDIVPIQDLGNYDYTAQVATNHYASEEYSLRGPKQAEIIKKFETQLQTKASFTMDFGGKSYAVSQAPIPEVQWTLVVME